MTTSETNPHAQFEGKRSLARISDRLQREGYLLADCLMQQRGGALKAKADLCAMIAVTAVSHFIECKDRTSSVYLRELIGLIDSSFNEDEPDAYRRVGRSHWIVEVAKAILADMSSAGNVQYLENSFAYLIHVLLEDLGKAETPEEFNSLWRGICEITALRSMWANALPKELENGLREVLACNGKNGSSLCGFMSKIDFALLGQIALGCRVSPDKAPEGWVPNKDGLKAIAGLVASSLASNIKQHGGLEKFFEQTRGLTLRKI